MGSSFAIGALCLREIASLDMSCTYADKAAFYQYSLLLPLFIAANHLSYAGLRYWDITMVALTLEEAMERAANIKKRIPPGLGDDMHRRLAFFRFQI